MSKKSASEASVVLFLGDPSVVDPLVHALVDERMGQASQALDFEVFRFGERPMSEIDAALRQVGMFSTRRCVWLRSFADAKRKPAAEESDDETGGEGAGGAEEDAEAGGAGELLALLERGVPAGTSLVVSAPGLDARSRLYKWFTANADVRDKRVQTDARAQRGKHSETGLRHAIEAHLRDIGVEHLAADALDEIVRRSGSVIGETLQEIDRVVLAQSEPTRLSGAQVRSTMRDLALGWVFDFTGSLEARDLAAAEALIARLLAEGEPPLRLVALLASHIARLVVVRPFVDQLPRGALRMGGAEFLAGPGASLPEGLRGWPGYHRLRGAANFTLEELRRLHGDVRRLDAALKSSAISPLLLFSRLLQNVCIAASRTPGRAPSR